MTVYYGTYYGYTMEHHGIKGQKWGVRRYQNEDGTLTPEGKMRYLDSDSATTKRVKNDWNNLTDDEFRRRYSVSKKRYLKRVKKYGDPYMNSPLAKAGKKINATKYGQRVNKRLFNERRNAFKMAGKAAMKTISQNMKISLATSGGAVALAATGHPIAASLLAKVGTVSVYGNTARNVVKTAKDIKKSNEYLRIQKQNNM